MLSRTAAVAALLLIVGGCSSSAVAPTTTGQLGDAGGVACDPLAAPPITLGTTVDVGQDTDGALYVFDAANGVFVSSNGSLIRQQVVEGGTYGGGNYSLRFMAPGADPSSARGLTVLQMGDAGSVTMSLTPRLDGGSTTSTDLTVVAASTVEGMPIVNTPNLISYFSTDAGGYVLLGTVPLNAPFTVPDGGIYDGGLSIFYGPPSAVAQRVITLFEQSLVSDGDVGFLVDGASYYLEFDPAPDAGVAASLARSTDRPDVPNPITLASPTPVTLPPGLSFTCLP
jgi:hypothetical protein